MVQDFAVSTKFSIARVSLRGAIVLFFRIRIFDLFTLLLLVLVGPVARILLLSVSLRLLMLLRPERCNVLFTGGVSGVLLDLVDDVNHGPLLLVCFDSVVCEEGVVGVVNCQPGLVLVRQQFSDIFRCCRPEDLSEQKFAVSLDAVVGVICKHIFCEGTLWLDWCRSFRFDSVAGVVLVERIDKFF